MIIVNIIYLSNSCSDTKFNYLSECSIVRELPQAQKYHDLMRKGIVENTNDKITALSVIPTNRQWTKRFIFKRETEYAGSINYIYPAFYNFPILRQLSVYNNSKKELKKLIKNRDKSVIICDVLNQFLAKSARKIGKKYNIPVVGIVTDVNGYRAGAQERQLPFVKRMISKFAEKVGANDLDKYDAYLLLTEAMNDVVNTNNKPYIVLEGHSDSSMKDVKNELEDKSSPKVAMYAGSIHREYGIERLANAFVKGGFSDWELHIYGDGNFRDELEAISSKVLNIKYYGLQPNDLVVKEQIKASLLINPRPTDADFVKYSFPSKTMEYMASGTPLCTTRLPGMPEDYYPYLYFFDDESEEGILKVLKEVFAKSADELHQLGIRAKHFVMTEKTNINQAKKLIDFINTL